MGQRFTRYSVSLNNTVKPTTWFEMGGRLNGSWQVQEYGQDTTGGSGGGDIYGSALRIYPYAMPYDYDGNRIEKPGMFDKIYTVVDEWMYSQNQRQILNVFSNIYAQLQLP